MLKPIRSLPRGQSCATATVASIRGFRDARRASV